MYIAGLASETVRLCGWAPFEESADTIRALLFGQMVKRAVPVTKEYLSDLYHDAQWIGKYVTGPTTFDFVVRHSGTNINESAHVAVRIGAGEGAKFYRVTLFDKDVDMHGAGNWHVTFVDVPLGQVASLPTLPTLN